MSHTELGFLGAATEVGRSYANPLGVLRGDSFVIESSDSHADRVAFYSTLEDR